MGSEVTPRDGTHQSLSDFVASTGRNTTGVELGPNARTVLWICLGVLAMPYVLKLSWTLYDDGGLWFGDGLVLRFAGVATSGPVLAVSGVLFLIVAATLIAARLGPPTTPLLTASAFSAVAASAVAIPVGVVALILVANLVAVLVVAALVLWFVALAIDSWLNS